MANEAYFAVTGYVATQPKSGEMRDGTRTLSMRVAWTPRVMDKATGQWTDRETSFVTVNCYRRIAENAWRCVRRGDPITVKGSLRVREYTDQAGVKRYSVEVAAESLGHDMSKGISNYTKVAQHSEQTAEEYERSNPTERHPLPGDMALAGPPSEDSGDQPQMDEGPDVDLVDDSADEPDPAELASEAG